MVNMLSVAIRAIMRPIYILVHGEQIEHGENVAVGTYRGYVAYI